MLDIIMIENTSLIIRILKNDSVKIEGDITWCEEPDEGDIYYRFSIRWDGQVEFNTATSNTNITIDSNLLYIGDLSEYIQILQTIKLIAANHFSESYI